MSKLIVKLVYSSNSGIFDGHCNREGLLYLGHYARWYGDEYVDDTFHTSSIASYEINGSNLVINTLNSVYVFEIVSGEVDESQIVLASSEIIEEQRRRNAIKYSTYWCQVESPGNFNHLITLVNLPYPMNKQEAIDYVSLGTAFTQEGYLAKIILMGCMPLNLETNNDDF